MRSLQGFSDAATPVFEDLDQATPALTEATRHLGPFTAASTVALKSLGNAGEASGPMFRAADPVVKKARNLARSGASPTTKLAKFLVSTKKTGGFDGLVDLIYNSTGALNEFDKYGHFVRSLVVLANCVEYVSAPRSGCKAHFTGRRRKPPRSTPGRSTGGSRKKWRKCPVAPRRPPPAPAPSTALRPGRTDARPRRRRSPRRRRAGHPDRPVAAPAGAPRLPPRTMRRPQRNTGSREQPGHRRRGHRAGRDRRRLPRLQRQQRPSLRLHLRPQGQGAERQRAGQRQRGADRRRPGGRGQVGRPGPASATAAVAAELSLSLDKIAEPIPVDSTMIIRPKSPLGLKYLQIVPGDSSKGFEAGETIPLSAARPEPVDIDQFFDMFDEKTRNAIRAERGRLRQRLRRPRAAAQRRLRRPAAARRKRPSRRCATSSRPRTDFGGFWEALEELSATVAPVAEMQASLFVALDRTFAAFARVSRPFIQETISKGPQTLDAAIADLPVMRPVPARARNGSSRRFEPGAKALAETSPTIDAAAARRHPGAQRARRSSTPSSTPTADALLAFQAAPGVFNGLDLLIDTNEGARPGDQVHRPRPDHLQLPDARLPQPRQRLQRRQRPGELGRRDRLRAAERAELRGQARPRPPPTGRKPLNHLHYNPYPNTASPGQTKECEAGNEPYTAGRTVIGNVAGQPGHHDPRTTGRGRLMGRLPERDTQGRGREERALQVASEQRDDRGDLPARLHDRPLPGLHQTHSLHQLRLRAERDLRQRGQHLDQLAGADRRGRRRQSDRGRTRRRRDRRSPSRSTARAGRSTTTPSPQIRPRIFLEGNFFIELDPGSPSAPEMDSGGTIPVSHTSTAVQLDEILTALQSPVRADLSRLLEGFGTALNHAADRRRRRDPAARGAGQDRRRRRSTAPSTTAATPAATAPRSPTPCSAPAAHDLSRLVAGAGPHLRRPRPARGRPAGPDRQLRHLHRRPRRPVGEPRDDDPAPRADPDGSAAARWSASTARCRRCAPGRSSSRRPSPSCPDLIAAAKPWLDAGAAAALRQGGRRRREAAARSDAGAGRRRPGGQGERAAAAQPAQPLHDQGPRPDRQPDDRRPVQHRRPQLPRVLLHADRLRRPEPELRRQRALPPRSSPAAADVLRRTEPTRTAT